MTRRREMRTVVMDFCGKTEDATAADKSKEASAGASLLQVLFSTQTLMNIPGDLEARANGKMLTTSNRTISPGRLRTLDKTSLSC